jgi:hypothetical protein
VIVVNGTIRIRRALDDVFTLVAEPERFPD